MVGSDRGNAEEESKSGLPAAKVVGFNLLAGLNQRFHLLDGSRAPSCTVSICPKMVNLMNV